MRDRQVDDLLREVMSGFHRWMPETRRGEPIDPLRRLPAAEVGHLRQSVSDLLPPQPPAPLREWDDDAPPDGDTRAWGGPDYAAISEHLEQFMGDADSIDVADAFRAAPEAVRRPVDLLGLLEIAHQQGMAETDEVSVVEAVRPDRTRRQFMFGGVITTVKHEATDD
jgi:hypothetical protein